MLRRNVVAARLTNVVVVPVAAGRAYDTRELYVRGAISAVNSLFPRSCYASVTDVLRVPVRPLVIEWHPLLQQLAGFAPDARLLRLRRPIELLARRRTAATH